MYTDSMHRRALAILVPSFFLLAACSSSDGGSPSDLGDAGGDGARTETGDPDAAFDVVTSHDAPDTSCRAYDAAKIDCARACANFQAWCDSDAAACANPYCGKAADCATACNVSKDTLPETNVLFGCAAENTDCAAFRTCDSTKCKG